MDEEKIRELKGYQRDLNKMAQYLADSLSRTMRISQALNNMIILEMRDEPREYAEDVVRKAEDEVDEVLKRRPIKELESEEEPVPKPKPEKEKKGLFAKLKGKKEEKKKEEKKQETDKMIADLEKELEELKKSK